MVLHKLHFIIYPIISQNATWLATPELLPTEIRTFGHAICISFSKFGSFIVPYIVISNLNYAAISIILSVFNIIAALLALTLRETVGKCCKLFFKFYLDYVTSLTKGPIWMKYQRKALFTDLPHLLKWLQPNQENLVPQIPYMKMRDSLWNVLRVYNRLVCY